LFSETVINWISHYGYAGLFTLLTLGVLGLPVPDEILLVYAGYLIYKGDLSAGPTYLAAALGSMCGITVSYLLGVSGGSYLVKRFGPIINITDEKIKKVHWWFERVGKWFLMFGYYIAGVRHLTAFVAGSSKLEWHVFAFFAYAGAVIWSATFISIGWRLGRHWHTFAVYIDKYILIVLIGTAAAAAMYLFVRKRFFAAKG
jgi:membrane protein DedA with SNARE-associated domain